MKPAEIIALVCLVLAVGGAVFYIIRAKRRGNKCIGCPHNGSCAGLCSPDCKGSTTDENKGDKH